MSLLAVIEFRTGLTITLLQFDGNFHRDIGSSISSSMMCGAITVSGNG